jgi:hypothetical protein
MQSTLLSLQTQVFHPLNSNYDFMPEALDIQRFTRIKPGNFKTLLIGILRVLPIFGPLKNP